MPTKNKITQRATESNQIKTASPLTTISTPLIIAALTTMVAGIIAALTAMAAGTSEPWWFEKVSSENRDYPSKPSPFPLMSTPSGKLHIWNGSDEEAIQKAKDTNINDYRTSGKNRNVLGTDENIPAFAAKLPLTIPNKGMVCVTGKSEIHADSTVNASPMMMLASVSNDGTIKESIPINIDSGNPKVLKEAQAFYGELNYQLNEVNEVQILVENAGEWGFFLNEVKFYAYGVEGKCPRN